MNLPSTVQMHRKLRRKAEFLARIQCNNDDSLAFCPIPGCGRRPEASVGKGASRFYCRYHVQRRNRHGSFFKGTYSAADLSPYRRGAVRFLKSHRDDFWVEHAISALQALLDNAGPVERMVDIYRLAPQDKANAAFARMRRKGTAPLKLLVDHLAIAAAVVEDPIRPGDEDDDYRVTQWGKIGLRASGGYHAIYGDSPRGPRYDRYQRSSGRALRFMGLALAKCCEHVVDKHLPAILELKVARYGARGR